MDQTNLDLTIELQRNLKRICKFQTSNLQISLDVFNRWTTENQTKYSSAILTFTKHIKIRKQTSNYNSFLFTLFLSVLVSKNNFSRAFLSIKTNNLIDKMF